MTERMTSDHREMVALGAWPRAAAQVLRARLERASISVLLETPDGTGEGSGADTSVLLVPAEHADFARAVVNELDADDEVPDTSPHAYLARIDEHLAAAAELVHELRTRLDAEDG